MSQLKVTYINSMGNDLTVTNSARISFNTTNTELTEKDKKLIKYLADNEHLSPFEHVTLTVLVECPLYIRSQIHRHRTFSYSEVSRRYTSEDISLYVPEVLRKQAKSNRQASEGELSPTDAMEALEYIESCHSVALHGYNELLKLGISREIARGLLPQNTMTKFYQTGNLRNWAHFLKLRLDNHAQWEVQQIALQIKDIMLTYFPEATKALLNKGV